MSLRSSGGSGRTALYRHFDSAGVLLYVGISLGPVNRLQQHKRRSGWFSQIARVDVEWFDSRAAALKAEATAIFQENPLHNIQRPKSDDGIRPLPIPSETNEVRVRGEALHPVLWAGKQWAVTEYGIECRDGTYAIERRRLHEGERHGYSWAKHMGDKEWVDLDDFAKAHAMACFLLNGERFVMPGKMVRVARAEHLPSIIWAEAV